MIGWPPIERKGFGAGVAATAPCKTGLPLKFSSVVGAGAGAGATATGAAAGAFLVRSWLTSCLSCEFSFSSLSRRCMTSSSVAAEAAWEHNAKLSAAVAVPAINLDFMTYPPSSTSCHSRLISLPRSKDDLLLSDFNQSLTHVV